MSPAGTAQIAAQELVDSILDTIVRIFENHVIVGELLESKSSQDVNLNTPKAMGADVNWSHDSDASHDTGGYTIGFSLTVLQSECQQLICEILRATPEAASADAAVQTARLANKAPSKDKRQAKIVICFHLIYSYKPTFSRYLRFFYLALFFWNDSLVCIFADIFVVVFPARLWLQYDDPLLINVAFRDGSEDGLTFAFRFTDATSVSVPNQGADHVRQGWRRGPNVVQEGYGSGAVLPEQGIYLAASVYRPVLQFTDKVASLLPQKFSQLGKRSRVRISVTHLCEVISCKISGEDAMCTHGHGPAAFRPRANAAASYTPSIEKGRPVLQGLLAIDFLAKEVLGWAQAMPKFSTDLINYVQTFLERTYERCRTSYMEAVLEKQSYMLIGRHDVENLLRLDPASACLPDSLSQRIRETDASDAESTEVETQLSEVLLNLRPIKQENLIRDDNKLILLASLSDSLEYVADSIERQVALSCRHSLVWKSSPKSYDHMEENGTQTSSRHTRTSSAPPKDLASFAEEYRKLAIDCLKVLRIEMQLETIFHMQEMAKRDYLDDQDAEEPDDFVISLTSQVTRRDEEMTPFVADVKRNYIFGGICGIAANLSIKALAAISSIDSEVVQMRLDRVRTYYELLNMPFEVPGREIPDDALDRVTEIMSH
ncbi:exocyst complex component sec8 [Phtheirospermum japonicum]|uniref:Exocyst complex component Sec8 n=1 Tax=Phtheirospermum japonicum TaxID=374723 RepID=A0A830BRY0_9LAMI|nr:exocyst complex component sec8 [Phtheirospermum japonicum]